MSVHRPAKINLAAHGWVGFIHRPAGFSLLELLVVMAIIVIVASFSIAGLRGMQRGYQLTKAANQVKDSLQLARQLAMTRNEQIVASFCKVRDDFGSQGSLNALQLSRVDTNGTMEPVARLVRFPYGFSISENSDWSSIVGLLPETNTVVQATSVPCRQIRFRPSGFTALPSSNACYLTIYNSLGTATPSNNFVTLSMDPVTGRVSWNQP